uniref:(California timema) hypothetical protein n=1 Tax=Timema californicum TaxID=61474 RepID=A0A7R9P6V4_TIMCA|nr:unnamed protein product [Timema californicum]
MGDDMLATRCVRDDILATRCVRDDMLATRCVRDDMLATSSVIILSRMCVLSAPSLCEQDTAELYLVFFLCYIVLVPLQLYAATRQKHPVTRLFTASLLLEFLALCFILIHVLKFAFDGVGVGGMAVAGDILDILSRTSCAHKCLGSHIGITYSADCLAYCVMTHLLWPARSEQYFLLAEEADLGDELDEFNEAPHVINNYTRLSEPPDLGKIIA